MTVKRQSLFRIEYFSYLNILNLDVTNGIQPDDHLHVTEMHRRYINLAISKMKL